MPWQSDSIDKTSELPFRLSCFSWRQFSASFDFSAVRLPAISRVVFRPGVAASLAVEFRRLRTLRRCVGVDAEDDGENPAGEFDAAGVAAAAALA